MNSLIEFIKTMGAARLAAMGAVTALLIGFFTIVIMRISTPAMAPLFTELSLDDSAKIAKDLDAQGINFELRAEGSTIMVPKADVTRLRMKLAEAGVPRGGSVGYEIFDKSDTLGTTSFVQNVNHLRALEGELARTIRSIDRVSSARVHLVIPERQLFARDKQDPSAAIVLKLRGSLDASQVRAIRHLTASAVRGLKPEKISIVDERGKLLADGSGNEADPVANGLDDRHAAFEKRIRDQVESIVSNIVGPGRARVQVAAEVDYSRIQQTSDTFDPESKVARSTQTREESSGTTSNEQGVTVGNEVPPVAQRGPAAAAAQNPAPTQRDQSKKTEETINYEISRTTRSETTEAGRVKRISVAVLVDGSYAKADKGEMTYQPRSKEEIEQITALVKSAIGFEQKRGDQVEVVNLRFADSPVVPVAAEEGGFFSMLRFTTDDIFQGVQILVIVMLSGLVLLFVIRPLVRRIITPDESVPLAPAPAPAVVPALPEPSALLSPDNPAARLIEVAKIQGEVQAQSIQKVGELADRNPHETVSIIRQWMHETKV
ncbi:MAG TPA: flagellar basal-body MS-ring/collar protein FliF [Xanthobacteraceae bacterium]|nr:flagellar basal-body MS-ring/collar protein FliF [Xanthobacteraceae bacterium]